MTSFELFICLLINFKAEVSSGAFATISTIVSVFFLVLLLLMTVLFIVMLIVDKEPNCDNNNDEEEVKERNWPKAYLNTLYLNMAPTRRRAANVYLLSYMFRRALYAICIVIMQDYPSL